MGTTGERVSPDSGAPVEDLARERKSYTDAPLSTDDVAMIKVLRGRLRMQPEDPARSRWINRTLEAIRDDRASDDYVRDELAR